MNSKTELGNNFNLGNGSFEQQINVAEVSTDLGSADFSKFSLRDDHILVRSLRVFNKILPSHSDFKNVSFNFIDPQNTSRLISQVQLVRDSKDSADDRLSVNILSDPMKKGLLPGSRYSNLATRAFSIGGLNGEVLQVSNDCESDKIGISDKSLPTQAEVSLIAEICMNVLESVRSRDLVMHDNPQGPMEILNFVLGDFPDAGGQIAYVSGLVQASANKESLFDNVDKFGCSKIVQAVFTRATPAQNHHSHNYSKESGIHFYIEGDKIYCLVFIEDDCPFFLEKEKMNPKFSRVTKDNPVKEGDLTVTINHSRFAGIGISKGVYKIDDLGKLGSSVQPAIRALDYLGINENMGEKVFSIDAHYCDGAFRSQLIKNSLGMQELKIYHFLHSMGALKAEKTGYPTLREQDPDKAYGMLEKLDFINRILSECWTIEQGQILVANSDMIEEETQRLYGVQVSKKILPGVDPNIFGNTISREERKNHPEFIDRLYQMYEDTLTLPWLELSGISKITKLTKEQLCNGYLIHERSRHEEPGVKGKPYVVKSVKKALEVLHDNGYDKDKPMVLIINLNYNKSENDNPGLFAELKSLKIDIQKIFKNGGHVIVQTNFDFRFAAILSSAVDCVKNYAEYEPFGMGPLESGYSGALVFGGENTPSGRSMAGDENDNTFFESKVNGKSAFFEGGKGAIIIPGKVDLEQHNLNSAFALEQAYKHMLGLKTVNYDFDKVRREARKIIIDTGNTWDGRSSLIYKSPYYD